VYLKCAHGKAGDGAQEKLRTTIASWRLLDWLPSVSPEGGRDDTEDASLDDRAITEPGVVPTSQEEASAVTLPLTPNHAVGNDSIASHECDHRAASQFCHLTALDSDSCSFNQRGVHALAANDRFDFTLGPLEQLLQRANVGVALKSVVRPWITGHRSAT
jgi:hypothetical protein